MNIFALFLPFLIPMITEAVKQSMQHLIGKMPAKAVPVLAAVLGAACSQLPVMPLDPAIVAAAGAAASHYGPITDPGVGLLAGMAGVSVHQVFAGK